MPHITAPGKHVRLCTIVHYHRNQHAAGASSTESGDLWGSGVQRYSIWVMKSATKSSIIGVGSKWKSYDEEIRSMKRSTSEQTVEVTDALLRENAEMLQNRAASPLDEVKVESTGRNTLWEVDVRGAPSMLPLVARNLLSNAVKYSRLRDPAIIKGRSISDEHEIVFFVRDNGVGCDIQYADKRLGIFQRLHNARKSPKVQVLDSPA